MEANVTYNLKIDRDRLDKFCQKHRVRRLWLLGSALRDDFTDQSDVDVLYEFDPGCTPGLGIVRFADGLSELFGGRRIDLVSERFLNEWVRRQPSLIIQIHRSSNQPASV